MLEFVHSRYNYSHLLKLDDDCYVQPSHLLKLFHTQRSVNSYVGLRRNHGRPVRDPSHAFYLSEQDYFMQELPPHATGFAYLLSWDLVDNFYKESTGAEDLSGPARNHNGDLADAFRHLAGAH
ncbi:unnamed protein product [Polarella glacialis]|uniref:Hexosyltransferase n=1 Tax=Polarella glacialis TaxID=89957 RepID=A0A813FS87_POLGL|nr:unnamed protein product [Polarella glacialis]